MTKAQYYEMCEALNSEPVQSEIPVELDDFSDSIQLCFSLYDQLSDQWDYMAGNYIGKNLTNIFKYFDLYYIDQEERLLLLRVISIIDNKRRALIKSKNSP